MQKFERRVCSFFDMHGQPALTMHGQPAPSSVGSPRSRATSVDGEASSSSSNPPLFGEGTASVHAHYAFGDTLGTGNFAKVIRATCRCATPHCRLAAGDTVAIKVVRKPLSRSAERRDMIRAEVEILRSVQHPNIVRLFEVRSRAESFDASPGPPVVPTPVRRSLRAR